MHQHGLASYASLTKAILKARIPERFDVCLRMFCFIICIGIDSVNLTGESIYMYIYKSFENTCICICIQQVDRPEVTLRG